MDLSIFWGVSIPNLSSRNLLTSLQRTLIVNTPLRPILSLNPYYFWGKFHCLTWSVCDTPSIPPYMITIFHKLLNKLCNTQRNTNSFWVVVLLLITTLNHHLSFLAVVFLRLQQLLFLSSSLALTPSTDLSSRLAMEWFALLVVKPEMTELVLADVVLDRRMGQAVHKFLVGAWRGRTSSVLFLGLSQDLSQSSLKWTKWGESVLLLKPQ